MKKKIYNKYLVVLFILLLFASANSLLAVQAKKKVAKAQKTAFKINNIGEFFLQISKDKQNLASYLLFKPSNQKAIILDSYEGLVPYELQYSDLDSDGRIEIISTLRFPESENVIPYIYTLNTNKKEMLEKIFPKEENESKMLNCREVYFNNKGNQQILYLKYLVNFHDYAPPELYRLEMYQLKNGLLTLTQVGYNEGTHFNLLMNLGTEYLFKGKSAEAVSCYSKALDSQKGNMPKKAIPELLFYYAEALKFAGKYSEAMKNFEEVVLKYTDSEYTEIAQKELEFLNANINNPKNVDLLNKFFKILLEIDYTHSAEGLNHLDKFISENKDCNFMDRLLYMKAELLIADNRLDEAMEIFTNIKANFPNSNLISLVEEMIENLDSKPEDIEGL